MSGIELVTTLILQAVPKLVTPRTLAFTMGSPLLLAQILDTVPKIFVDITILLLQSHRCRPCEEGMDNLGLAYQPAVWEGIAVALETKFIK